MRDTFRNALILTGPTGSGKSALALDLAPAVNAEIVSMDSMTLYRGMDIGTAKPTRDERQRVPHHLIDVLDPWESANVAWWLDQAEIACRDITAHGKRPLFVGGTPFYLKALLHGLFESPPASVAIRSRLEAAAERDGAGPLHARLRLVDSATAGRLHPNDVRRVVRALEVFELTGKPISAWQQQGWWNAQESPEAGRLTEDGLPRCLVMDIPREELYHRINRRVQAMFAEGWVEEVARLLALDKSLSKEASQAIGYREIIAMLNGAQKLADTISLVQTRTRQFAKRQLTWFRGLKECRSCDPKLTFDVWTRKMGACGLTAPKKVE